MAADGVRIPNAGQQLVQCMTIDGSLTEIRFQLAAINKPLVSVSKLIENGYRVSFVHDNSYTLHKKNNDNIKMRKERGVFVVDAWVPSKAEQGFSGQR